tara:strand:- start:1799 stop:2011 length:213 start_codon:yes stop_codon:yes gene_type:complete
MSEEKTKIDVQESATQPARARTDAGEVEQHKLSDLIEAEKYLAGKDAIESKTAKRRGLRFNKLIPPGAMD